MATTRKIRLITLLCLFTLSACSISGPDSSGSKTPALDGKNNDEAGKTPTPIVSKLNVDEEALHGKQVMVWHPWFGAEASLFEAQVKQFNSVNQWGVTVNTESKVNYNELFLQTDLSLRDSTNPEIVIGLPEYALAWDEHVLDLNPYVNDPVFGLRSLEITEFPSAVWMQDEVDGKRYGMPAQRTARFIIYNSTWARELGFNSAPQTSTEFDKQACAANSALRNDSNPDNDSLGGWLIDTNGFTPLAWMYSFGGGVQEEQGYRFLSPKNIDTFKFLKQLQQKGCAWVPSQEISVYDRFASRQALFATASLEEFVDQSRAFSALGNDDEWKVLPFPGGERTAFVIYGSSFFVFDSDDETQLASWLFIRWMLSAENQAKWVQSTGLFPLRSSTVSLVGDYAASHPQWADAVRIFPQGRMYPQLASWQIVKVMMGDAFRDSFDTIRHPDITDGQIPLILRQMDETAEELSK